MQRGMDLLGPFAPTYGQLRFLIIYVDYFTKWIKAETIAKITVVNVLKFFVKNVLARFGLPQSIVTDNGTQFIDGKLRNILEELRVK